MGSGAYYRRAIISAEGGPAFGGRDLSVTMIRGLFVFFIFFSIVFFPWPLTAVLTLISAFFLPFLPLAAGLFADTLYYTPHTALVGQASLPLFTLYGAMVTGGALFVRSRLKTSSIQR